MTAGKIDATGQVPWRRVRACIGIRGSGMFGFGDMSSYDIWEKAGLLMEITRVIEVD